MSNAKSIQALIAQHFKFSVKLAPSFDRKRKDMERFPHASVVRSIRYFMACTRPDLVYASSLISRYMADLGKSHWEAIKWVLRYLKSTSEYVLVYKKVGNS